MPDFSSLILHTQDFHLAPSRSPQCGASVSGDHTTAPQLPSSSGIQHQIHVFRLPTNCVWQRGSWMGREDGAHSGARSGCCQGRSHPPSPAGRQQLPSCSLPPLPLPHMVPSPTFPLKEKQSCKSKSELLTSMIKIFKGNYINGFHYNEIFADWNHRLTGKVSPQ